MRLFNGVDVGRVFGARPTKLAGYERLRASALDSGSPGLTLDQLEYLAAHQTPYRIGKAAAARLARQREREAERARIAGQLLRANLSTPGKRFSMNDAALARVAAGATTRTTNEGATSGSDEDVVVFVDKRKLRGEAKLAEYARLKGREQLPPSTLGKVRGNGKAKRPKGVAVERKPRDWSGWRK